MTARGEGHQDADADTEAETGPSRRRDSQHRIYIMVSYQCVYLCTDTRTPMYVCMHAYMYVYIYIHMLPPLKPAFQRTPGAHAMFAALCAVRVSPQNSKTHVFLSLEVDVSL